ncbi:MAG TPA: type III pantothenate kinase [Gemmataceae bacterium]
MSEFRPDVVADIGNSRVKWGRCGPDRVTAAASLPPEDPDAWDRQRAEWGLPAPLRWVLAGVHPVRLAALVGWLGRYGDTAVTLDHWSKLPLVVAVESPERVGIDRLLNAVGVRSRLGPGEGAVVVDAGTAVTVDHVTADGVFRGGAILPGFRLMAEALHRHTAQLPRADVRTPAPPQPGQNTERALETGLFWAVAGGVRALVEGYRGATAGPLRLFLTGGDAPLLLGGLPGAIHWPELTLEGVRLSAIRHSDPGVPNHA